MITHIITSADVQFLTGVLKYISAFMEGMEYAGKIPVFDSEDRERIAALLPALDMLPGRAVLVKN